MTPKKQVSPVIRISRGERDASARATHLEAATRKFLVTTNERKYMSTKTNFKRIALVAVAALGLGVLSSVPSQAITSGFTVTVSNGTAGLPGVRTDSTNAATINIQAVLDGKDSITVRVVQKSVPTGAGTLAPVFYNLDSSTPTLINTYGTTDAIVVDTTISTAVSATTARFRSIPEGVSGTPAGNAAGTGDTATATTGFRIASGYSAGTSTTLNWNFGLQLDSGISNARVAGTYTYSLITELWQSTGSGGVTGAERSVTQTTRDISITIAAASTAATTPSAVTSFVNLKAAGTAAGTATAADAVTNSVGTAGTTAGYLFVGNRNAADGSATATDSITATVTGAGLVCTTTGFASPTVGTCGKSIKVSAIGDVQFALQADGTSGNSSITVSSSVAGWSYTKVASYYLAAAKTLTATVAHPNLKIGTNSGAVRVTGVDATGSAWMGTAYIVASTAADALVGGSATTPVQCGAYSTTLGYASCDISTLTTGTAKFKVIDAATVALATATSNEVTVTVTNAVPATVKLSFDKATYAPNERARIYVTPLDSAGKEMQSITADLLASGGITVNGAISYTGSTTTADSLTATSITTSASTSSTSGAKAGSMVYTVYMPSAGGTVSISATGGTGLPIAGRVAVTASATVTDSGAAALAAVNALATTVASLKTLITTLTNLVLKIQKKVKA